MTERHTVQHLDLTTTTGLWRVEGDSGTTYVVDLDARLALREPAPGAATGPYDGCWMHLIGVASSEDVDVIRLGQRHRWEFDPAPGKPGFTVWWIQTAVVAVERLDPADRPPGRSAAHDEDRKPFGLDRRERLQGDV